MDFKTKSVFAAILVATLFAGAITAPKLRAFAIVHPDTRPQLSIFYLENRPAKEGQKQGGKGLRIKTVWFSVGVGISKCSVNQT